MTRYEKTPIEANAQCHELFQDALNKWLDPHHIEQELQNQAHQAQDDEEQNDVK